MSRLRDELFSAKIENATLKLEVDSLRRERDRLEKDYQDECADNRTYVDLANTANAEAAELRTKNAVILERLDLVTNYIPPAPTQAFNTVSEEQEDADYALHAGLIEREEYEAILASAGALNTEISFDADLTRL